MSQSLVLSPMSNYYHGKNIFLTGGSGFLGQLYIQKLLRIKIGFLYLFMRQKRDQSIAQRLEKMFNDPLFDMLKMEVPDYLEKIKIISGSLDGGVLEMSDDDRKDVINNVDIVIHAAADVRFNRSLFDLVKVNVKGTRELLELAKQMRKLQLFTYISTCYSNCVRNVVEEKFYDPPINPNALIDLIDKFEHKEKERELLDLITMKFIRPWPNTYTFSKAMSEAMLKNYENDLPICVVRPSIIMSTYKDPEAGWVSGYFGFTGLLYAVLLGVMRVANVDNSKRTDIICADFVVNSTLAIIWTMSDDQFKTKNESIPNIFNIASGRSNSFSFETFKKAEEFAAHVPISDSIWYPMIITTPNETLYKILVILLQIIPSVIGDIYCKCTRKTMRLLPLCRNIVSNFAIVFHFGSNEWTFVDDNMLSVYDKMTEYDKKLFPSDVRVVVWPDYIHSVLLGIRKYVHKDQADWLTAYHHIAFLKIIHQATTFFLTAALVFTIYYIFI